MRDLGPPPQLETPPDPYHRPNTGMGSIVRSVDPEDPYDDGAAERYASSYSRHERPGSLKHLNSSSYPPAPPAPAPPAPAPRQISAASHSSTLVSGSENWETYDDNSEPEPDATDAYYAKVRAARIKRVEPEAGHVLYGSQSKRPRGVPPAQQPGNVIVDYEGNRIVSGSEWTDEDALY